MKNILFYYPSNKRTISIESLIIGFRNQGHNVILLTQSDSAELHNELHQNNIRTYTYVIKKNNSLLYYLKHLFYLVNFCKKHNINIVYSHLQQANIISVFAQYFCKTYFYICRHHSSVSGSDKNFNQSLFDKIINRYSKLIIVPSKIVYKQVNEVERVSCSKIKLINYGYDFEKYPKPNLIEIENIRKKYCAKMILVKIARLVPGKRYDILFAVINKLVNEEKMDIKLLVISDGPLLNEFRVYLRDNNLEENIFLLGEVSNVIDYISIADAIPLLSEAEASNSVIKEAGLVNKCVIVCRGVGDFDDYIEDEISGLFMDKMNPFEDLKKHLTNIYESKVNKDKLGNNLHISVMNNFSIDHVINNYNTLNSIR